MVGSGIRPLQQSLYPLTWSLPLDTQIQILYWLFEVLVNIIRGTYWNALIWDYIITLISVTKTKENQLLHVLLI